jgi:hypothetical protein
MGIRCLYYHDITFKGHYSLSYRIKIHDFVKFIDFKTLSKKINYKIKLKQVI